MKFIEAKAPAKINIGLNILSKREDGFHNLSTLFYPINDLYDVLTFEIDDKFKFLCNVDSIPADKSNLVVKAKNILEKVSKKNFNVKIRLEKYIPSQAGLGGGSSDAAATLISLNKIYQLGLGYEQLVDLALKLGSDVPFFIKSEPAIGKGRGEILNFVDLKITDPILIVYPKINISTKEAFKNMLPIETQFDFLSCIRNGALDYNLMQKNVKNDFEKFIFEKYPEIEKIKDQLYNDGASFALLSGSGSTVYGIFPTLTTAGFAMRKFPKNYFYFLSNPHH